MAKKQKTLKENIIKRHPVVVIMGHIDHGKSTLLDYIRNSKVVEGEAGGITQHLSAYEVTHTTKEKESERITFLDTPGHEAFQKMRLRGADVADIAVLIVSAEDGVKPQTLEALESIKQAEIPYIVAINKIDTPNANIPNTQASLVENEIYLEGMGGDIPYVAISAKTGEGIPELLDLIVLSADLEDLKADQNAPASGTVIEAHVDPKRGNTATLLLKSGTLRGGEFVVSGGAWSPVRIMENHAGKSVKEASLSEAVEIVGFTTVPRVGDTFSTVTSKKEAETLANMYAKDSEQNASHQSDLPVIPILIKADVSGTIEAIQHELDKFESDRISVRVIDTGVGSISVSDVQNVSATKDAIIVGFNVKVDRAAQDLAGRLGVEIDTFSIIYELSEWLNTALKNRTPEMEEKVVTGKAKILKEFSIQKNKHVLGGRMEEGVLKMSQTVSITRRDILLGTGVVTNLQQYKADVQEVNEGEFGMQLETKVDIAGGDYIEPYDLVVS